ncbi:MAG: hypothetical protein ABSG17_23415 [Spirochaetia bacterium]
MQDKSRIARLIRDLEEIKAAVKRNSPVLREILAARFYWWLLLIFGVVVAAFSILMHFLVLHYGRYAGIPTPVKTVFWIVAAGAGAVMYVFRVRGVIRTIKRIDRRLNFWSLLGDHDIGEFMHLYGPFCVIAIAVTIYLSRTGNSFFIVGTWALCLGLTCNLLAFAAHLLDYYVLGYWYMVSATLSFFIPGVSASLWMAICFGGGSIAYAAVTLLSGLAKSGNE